jgi:hypothetical protein
MSEDLWSQALALPPAERAELAHALMDSLYREVDWDTGPGWRVTPDPELYDVLSSEVLGGGVLGGGVLGGGVLGGGVLGAVAEVVQLDQRRANPRRA